MLKIQDTSVCFYDVQNTRYLSLFFMSGANQKFKCYFFWVKNVVSAYVVVDVQRKLCVRVIMG